MLNVLRLYRKSLEITAGKAKAGWRRRGGVGHEDDETTPFQVSSRRSPSPSQSQPPKMFSNGAAFVSVTAAHWRLQWHSPSALSPFLLIPLDSLSPLPRQPQVYRLPRHTLDFQFCRCLIRPLRRHFGWCARKPC